MQAQKIREKFIAHVLEEGAEPSSIYAFAKKLKITEKEFYEHFNSFAQIEKDIWSSSFTDTIDSVQKEEVYGTYSIREKLLAFHFTLLENMKENRSYLLKSYDKAVKKEELLQGAKKVFLRYANELILEGRETREVENRPVPQIMQRYPDLLWMATKNILEFWMTDESKGFEKSDTMVEKGINTAMDWIGHSPLDSLFDLGKFMYQNGRKMSL